MHRIFPPPVIFKGGFTLRYALALLIVAAVIILAHLSIDQDIALDEVRLQLINTSGRQRLLSQRAALFATRLAAAATAAERQEYRRELSQTVTRMEQAHRQLSDSAAGAPGLSPALRRVYFEPPVNLDRQLALFLAQTRAFAALPDEKLRLDHPAAATLLTTARGPLLQALEAAVQAHESESTRGLDNLRARQKVFLELALLTIALIGLFVFYPMTVLIKSETGKLVAARNELDAILETVGEAIITLDERSVIIGINHHVERIWGYARPELVGEKICRLIAIADCDHFIPDRLEAGGTHEFRGRRKNGEEFPLELTLARTEVPQRTLTILSLADITDRRRAEESLRQQSAALAAAANGIVITDAAGTFIYVNPAFTRLTGYTREETLGQTPRLLKSGEQNPEYYRELWATITRGEAWHGELVNRRKDGTHYTEEQTIAPVRNRHGVITHYIAIKQDITDRKQVERLINEYAQEQKWTAFRISEALRRAQAATEAKSRFLATMSHELRTPLNAIIGFTAILRKNRKQNFLAADLDYLDRVLKNSTHLLALINDILDLSKIEADKQEVRTEPVDLAKLTGEVISQLEAPAKLKSVTLTSALPPGLRPLTTDGHKLKQVLINLVGNALKFTERGGITLQLEAGPDGTPLTLAVHDTGIGIPADKLGTIFESFQQADTGTARKYGGTGLGLTISRELCRLLGFELSVASRPGAGSTFTITFTAPGTADDRA